MTALEITAVLIGLLITILIILKIRKKCPSCSPCSSKGTLESEPSKAPEPKTTDKPIDNSKSSAKPQAHEPTTVSPPTKPQAKATAASAESNSLPQDSILRRHYLTHLCTMIESLSSPRPTDSVLCRHYDAMIVARIDQSLNNKKVMEQLICDYEKTKLV